MAVYPLDDLRTRINDFIYPNSQHLIDAEAVNNLMHDIVDSLEAVDSGPASSDSIKRFSSVAVSGSFTIDISGYEDKFYIDRIILTLKSGTPQTIRVGFSEFSSEVLPEAEIDILAVDTPMALTSGAIPKTGQDTLWFTIADGAAVFDISVILIRYKD